MRDALAAEGILVSCFGEKLLRFVTHLDIDDAHVEAAVQVCMRLRGFSSISRMSQYEYWCKVLQVG